MKRVLLCLGLIFSASHLKAASPIQPMRPLFRSNVVAAVSVGGSTMCGNPNNIKVVQSTGMWVDVDFQGVVKIATVTFNASVLPGRSIIVHATANNQLSRSTDITDNAGGNTWTLIGAEESHFPNPRTSVYYLNNIVNGGANFKVFFNLGIKDVVTFVASEVEGLSCTGLVDVSSGTFTTQNAIVTPTFATGGIGLITGVTSSADSVLSYVKGNSFTDGYSQNRNDTGNSMSFEYKVSTGAGVYAVDWQNTCGGVCSESVRYQNFR